VESRSFGPSWAGGGAFVLYRVGISTSKEKKNKKKKTKNLNGLTNVSMTRACPWKKRGQEHALNISSLGLGGEKDERGESILKVILRFNLTERKMEYP